MRNLLIRTIAFPFYEYPITRWAFKKFFRILSMVTRRDLTAAQTEFSADQSKILEQLKENGFFLAKPENFSLQFQQVQKRAMDAASRLIDVDLEKLQGTKQYLLNLDLSKAPESAVQSMYEFFSHPALEALAAAYLGERPLMVELKILISPALAMPDADGSQRWHSDFDDLSNLKLFVFLEEVTEDSGPLQVINKTLSRRLMKNFRYRWGRHGVSHNDAIVPTEYSSEKISLVGQGGCIAFLDAVHCLHRGSRNPQCTRKILYATYNTRSSFRFPPYHWIFGERFAGYHVSPLLKLDPQKKYLTDLAINE